MKKYEVVGEGYGCKDDEYIKCSVINQWDWKTKCTAVGTIGRNILTYHFIKYKRKESIAYNGKKTESYEPTEIKNPNHYPEIVDYCRMNSIEILN